MNLLLDLFSLLAGCVTLFAAFDRKGLYVACAVGILLAALCWFTCSRYSKLWNKGYQVHFVHHLLCCVAAMLTLTFAVVFAALKYTKEAAQASVMLWEGQINLDAPWASATLIKAYNKVKSLGVEDFTQFPPPPIGHGIPVKNSVSIHAAATVYATGASGHFNVARPFLSLILHGQTGLPTTVLDADVKNYFARGKHTYPSSQAITLVASEIGKDLQKQVPRVVTISRRVAVGGFLFVQLIPFGLVGMAAYRNLKVRM